MCLAPMHLRQTDHAHRDWDVVYHLALMVQVYCMHAHAELSGVSKTVISDVGLVLLHPHSHPLSRFSQIMRLAAPPASPQSSHATSSPCHSGRNDSCIDTLSDVCSASSFSGELIAVAMLETRSGRSDLSPA